MGRPILALGRQREIDVPSAVRFKRGGFKIARAAFARGAIRSHAQCCANPTLLEIGSPGASDVEVRRSARRRVDGPVVLVTAVDYEVTQLCDVRIGDDDYG